MTPLFRFGWWRLGIVAGLIGALCTAHGIAAQQSAFEVSSHVRPTNSRLIAALGRGFALSPTMHGLIVDIDAAPVIVYLHDAGCPSGAESCLMIGAATGGVRYLHVNFRLTDVRRNRFLDFQDRLVAQIAHELQHALEIARHASIVDGASLAARYRQLGKDQTRGARTFETAEALLAGRTVLRELAASHFGNAAAIGLERR